MTWTWFSLGWSKVLRHDRAHHRALHVGDLFRALVDQQDEEVHVRVVARDGVGELLEDRGLAGLGRRDDEAALSLADGAHEVHDARRRVVLLGLETQTLVGIQRRELLEDGPLAGLVRIDAVDRVDLEQGVVLLVVFGLAHMAIDLVSTAQAETTDLTERHVDVVVTLGETVGAQETESVGQHIEDAIAGDGRALDAILPFARLPRFARFARLAALAIAPTTGPLSLAGGLRAPGRLALALARRRGLALVPRGALGADLCSLRRRRLAVC